MEANPGTENMRGHLEFPFSDFEGVGQDAVESVEGLTEDHLLLPEEMERMGV